MTRTQAPRTGTQRSRSAPATAIERARALAMNLWWSWNHDAQRLFASLDPALWEATNHNPIRTLHLLSPERREAVDADANFAAHLARVEASLRQYLDTPTWFQRQHQRTAGELTIAYFCAEFAVHQSLPQYSGGLGVLAGDHVKSASDLGVPLVGVGLLYRNGFYTQEFAPDGATRVIYPRLDFALCPVTDTGHEIDVPMARRTVRARIWRQLVGRVPLFLLDTELPANRPADRAITRHLYGGDREYRIQQEILLGVGGVIALDAIGIEPSVYHLNEGHAAFCALERLRRFVDEGLALDEAKRRVRKTTVFTTHTPVPAGNDRFDAKLTLKYIRGYADALGASQRDLLALGREDESNPAEEFCMTVIALKLAGARNGVAELHGDTSRRMWTRAFGASDPRQVPIGHVTNGIHSQTWLPEEAQPLYERYLKPRWLGAGPDQPWWDDADKIPDDALWQLQRTLRAKLVGFARQRLIDQLTRQHAPIEERVAARTVLSPEALTLGFARRFATYKRAPLIFLDRKRLARILGDAARPVQILFAGKAHPADTGGQAFAREVFQHARRPEFRGRAVILEDYDMQLGRALTSGADVWLNNPLRPQEASGTSGMKPPLHGGLNLSILDGWWPEAYNRKNGWAIGDGRTFKTQSRQDRYDAGALYDLLETQLVPQFYARDKAGIPRQWVARMKNSIRTVCGAFNTHRMVGEYLTKYYLPASR
ncbi:MAG TPA: alpha-glucan family phosphorylase [Tepidisphaeraceae bacterium]|nr:alpha-glucan family phosphorylase [Tepidisphaeraceae bacterium]